MNDAFRLHGTRAVVTGGSSGIGAELCRALGRSGADIVSVHRSDPAGAAADDRATSRPWDAAA